MRYLIDHPEQDLDPRAFRPEAGRMRLYGGLLSGLFGGNDPPPAPDYAAAARETAAGNAAAVRAATRANRVNQITPFGSSTWRQNNVSMFDQAGFDKAMADFNSPSSGGAQPASQTSARFGRNESRPALSVEDAAYLGIAQPAITGGGGATRAAPRREDFMISDPDAGWEQVQTLTPQAQATLDKQLALSDQYADVAGIGFGKVRSAFENPELDVSQLPARAMNVGQTAQDAIMSRLGPQFQRQEEEMRTRLANQGITLGSDAYGREQQQFQQGRNDAMMQAALQGISLDQANRGAALQEQAFLKDRPLNLINALRTGAQVQSPQFQQFAQQQATTGPDMLSAANQQYGATMNAFNAKQASQDKMMGGLMDVGSQMAMAGLF